MKEKVERTIRALKRHRFEAKYVPDAEQAKRLILSRIPLSAQVGIPGSKTVRELGLDQALRDRGQITFDHWVPGLSAEESLRERKAQLTCDLLITSANAITEQGEIFNMDGVGNRIAPTIFGPEKVIIIAGINKLVPDLESARQRVRRIAAPKRAAELKIKVPCVTTGECNDCNSEARVCRAELVLLRAPSLTRIEVYLIGEDLGN